MIVRSRLCVFIVGNRLTIIADVRTPENTREDTIGREFTYRMSEKYFNVEKILSVKLD